MAWPTMGRRILILGGKPDRRGPRFRAGARRGFMAATPYQISPSSGVGPRRRDYHRLKAALDRLQSTTGCTSIRGRPEGVATGSPGLNEWTERTVPPGPPDGIELIVPDCFYRAVLDDALILTIDRAYFD